jgi:thiol-disulfide isomerase/thioredoxin/ribosomal 50S subunit-recycling heat shock protein
MKSIQTLLVGALAMLCACQPSQKSNLYTVTGELEDSAHHGKKIYIMNYDDNQLIDSTFVEGNKFVFKGEVDTASFCRIDVTRRMFANFILEGGDIKVNLQKYAQPSGTPMNDEMCRIAQEQDSILAYVRQKQGEIRSQHTDDEKAGEAMKQLLDEVRTRLAARCTELFAAHNDDVLGLVLMSSLFMQELDTDAKLQIISTFGPWLKPRVAETTKRLEALKNTAEGLPFTDIKGKDAEGNPVALSDYVGKGNYVLLDMWASWCGPCKGEIPNLLKLHNQYKDKGLTVLGLFVWDKVENLKKTMEAEGIVWPQIVSVENMDATDSYGVDGVPHIILFAPDGTILKRNLRGQNMIDTVDEVMKKK